MIINPTTPPSIDQNVASLMADVAARHPDKQALVIEKQGKLNSISFGQLWQEASAVAWNMKRLGLKSGDRVIIMIPMSIDLYVCLLGLIQMGAVVVFVDPWIGPKQIARFSEFAEPTGFIGINKSHLLRWSSRRLRKIRISVTNGLRIGPFLARQSLQRLKHGQPESQIAAVSPDQSALITFTSGSSGTPKGANRTHRFLLSQHLALKTEFPYQADDTDMPMFPVFALNNLVTGITSIVPEMDFKQVAKVDGDRILEQIIHHGITTCTASPPLLDNLSAALLNADEEVRSRFRLRRVLTGGAPVSDKQLVKWRETFQTPSGPTEIIVAYGSTEAEPVGHISAEQRLALSSTGQGFCTGRTTDLVQRIVIPIEKGPIDLAASSIHSRALSPGETGELVVAGDHVCRDYYKNDSATRENKLIDENGTTWHRMGDTGYFDDEERFWLVGRVHSTIFRNGIAIHPQVVEQIVSTACEEIVQVAAVGYEDTTMGELVIVMARIDGVQDLPAEIAARRKIRLALEKAGLPCDRVVFTPDELSVDPRHNAKIDYAQVKSRLPKSIWREPS